MSNWTQALKKSKRGSWWKQCDEQTREARGCPQGEVCNGCHEEMENTISPRGCSVTRDLEEEYTIQKSIVKKY